jgi:hypothetical protein
MWKEVDITHLKTPTYPEKKFEVVFRLAFLMATIQMKVECYVFCVYTTLSDALEGHLKYTHQLPYEYK